MARVSSPPWAAAAFGASALALMLGCSPGVEVASAPLPAAGAAIEPLTNPALRIACDAAYQLSCTPAGCVREGEPGPLVPLAFSFDGEAGGGDLCMATGCDPAVLARAPGWPDSAGETVFATVMTSPNPDRPGFAALPTSGLTPAGMLWLASDGAGFQFVQADGAGSTLWGGACRPAPQALP